MSPVEDGEFSDIPESSGIEGETSASRTEPVIGRVPQSVRDTFPGRGIVSDNGGAPSVVKAPDVPEGSTRARALTLRYYDIKMKEHRLWYTTPSSDQPNIEENTCSFPDYLVNAVEQERDYLLDERLGLTAQVELLQRDWSVLGQRPR